MTITIQPASVDDAVALTHIGHDAFQDDDLQKATFRLEGASDEDLLQYWSWRIGRMRTRIQKPGAHWLKAIDTATNEIVGFTGMNEPQQDQTVDVSKDQISWPEVVDVAIIKQLEQDLNSARKRVLGGSRDFWYIQSLVVHPAHQRRGIGQELLRANLDLVDSRAGRTYLEATPPGVRLYVANDFEQIDKIVMEDIPHTLVIMLRKQVD